jgi:hypothetical protein
MKVSEIVSTRPLLEKIAAKEMDSGAALEFAKFTVEVLKEAQAFDMKRAELFEKYGESEGEGKEKSITIKPENEKKFNAAIKRAVGKDVEIEPFDLSSLGIIIAPADLINALPLFK